MPESPRQEPVASSSKDSPAEVTALTCFFGRQRVLHDVSFTVPCGSVVGLVGQNGAGKTTTIRHLLGLLRSPRGQVRVFGMDPCRRPTEVLSRIGYLSEKPDLPAWMRVEEFLNFTSSFYPAWDQSYANSLMTEFDIDASKIIKNLSKGQQTKLGLVVAQAYRPELLILDEPDSGLDAIVRRDILEAVIRTVADDGRTVLFSSHLLDEVERVSDRVVLIDQGEVLLDGTLDKTLRSHQIGLLVFPTDLDQPPRLEGALHVSGSKRTWTVTFQGARERFEAGVNSLGASLQNCRDASLDEVFVARVNENNNEAIA